jgi:hypothetical protein
MKAALMSLIAVLFAVQPAMAQDSGPMTVGDLQQLCTAPDVGSKNACQFFIFGVAMGARLGALQAGNKNLYCIPDNSSAATLETVVKLKIGEDLMLFPKDRELLAPGFVVGVIFTTFPCRK